MEVTGVTRRKMRRRRRRKRLPLYPGSHMPPRTMVVRLSWARDVCLVSLLGPMSRLRLHGNLVKETKRPSPLYGRPTCINECGRRRRLNLPSLMAKIQPQTALRLRPKQISKRPQSVSRRSSGSLPLVLISLVVQTPISHQTRPRNPTSPLCSTTPLRGTDQLSIRPSMSQKLHNLPPLVLSGRTVTALQ